MTTDSKTYIIKAQRRGDREIREITSGERFDVKKDADYLAALLQEFSATTNYWAVEDICNPQETGCGGMCSGCE